MIREVLDLKYAGAPPISIVAPKFKEKPKLPFKPRQWCVKFTFNVPGVSKLTSSGKKHPSPIQPEKMVLYFDTGGGKAILSMVERPCLSPQPIPMLHPRWKQMTKLHQQYLMPTGQNTTSKSSDLSTQTSNTRPI